MHPRSHSPDTPPRARRAASILALCLLTVLVVPVAGALPRGCRSPNGRLTALRFDDSADRHNVSMGFYDPVQHVTSGDPLYGGNVPYRIEGLNVTDGMSQEWRSFCSVSVPDDVGGADGDMRFTGCPQVGGRGAAG
jgi:hypothetical protein